LVSTLIAAPQVAGRHVVRWDGRDARGSTVPAGTYFARLGVPGHIETQKITVVR